MSETRVRGRKKTWLPTGRARGASARVSLSWRGTVVDVRRVDARPTRLSTGHTAVVVASADGAHLLVDDVVVPLDGASPIGLDGDLAVIASSAPPGAPLSRARELDTRLFHATILAAACQVSLVAALLLTPRLADNARGGGGLPQKTIERLVRLPGGAARARGAEVRAVGRPSLPAERQTTVAEARGATSRRARPTPTLSLAEAIAAIERAVHRGSPVGALKETLGDLARSTARAPAHDAGIGGLLRPSILPVQAAASGEIGDASARLDALLDDETRRTRMARLEPLPPRTSADRAPPVEEDASPVVVVSRVDDGDPLDPVVRDHLATAVRHRQNAVRACYETFGLAQDASTSGRLVLSLTLEKDGAVRDAVVESDNEALSAVGRCVAERAGEWFLGEGLTDEPLRLAFPFVLVPRADHVVIAEDEAW